MKKEAFLNLAYVLGGLLMMVMSIYDLNLVIYHQTSLTPTIDIVIDSLLTLVGIAFIISGALPRYKKITIPVYTTVMTGAMCLFIIKEARLYYLNAQDFIQSLLSIVFYVFIGIVFINLVSTYKKAQEDSNEKS